MRKKQRGGGPRAARPQPPRHADGEAEKRRGVGPRGARPQPPRHIDGEIETTYGLRAGLAIAVARPDDVVRIAYSREVEREIAPLLRLAERRSLRRSVMSDAELARISGSTHHEGLVVAARPRGWLPAAKLGDVLADRRGTAIALDRVRNPYNVGAILRSAAFFGVDAAILGAPAPHPALAPDAIRVAEGGVEHLLLSRTTDLADTLSRLRARGAHVYGADGAARESAIGFAFERPAILVVGHEREGMSPRVRAQCDRVLAIPGSGNVESLNVAVATGVLLAELVRRRA